jgi:hypothetical protein
MDVTKWALWSVAYAAITTAGCAQHICRIHSLRLCAALELLTAGRFLRLHARYRRDVFLRRGDQELVVASWLVPIWPRGPFDRHDRRGACFRGRLWAQATAKSISSFSKQTTQTIEGIGINQPSRNRDSEPPRGKPSPRHTLAG